MDFLIGLHGSVAAALICILLFVDETGLPLPIAPNELLLLLAGVLIASGAFPLWVIFPLLYLAMAAGMLTGYSWARTIGQSGLRALAERVGATAAYDKAVGRLQQSTPWTIGICRLIPGLRPYATLVSGAAEVDVRTFLLGALPALLIWEIAVVAAGMIVGLPIAHFLGRFEKLALRGVLLVALGTVVWLAIRDATVDERGGIARIAPRLRASLALAVDAAIVVSVVGGFFAIARRVVLITANGWLEIIVAALVLIGLLLFGRMGQTPGEVLFETHYWHRVPA